MQLRRWFGILFAVLVGFRKIDGWVYCGVLLGVLFTVTVRAHPCSIDGRSLLGRSSGGCFWRCWCASAAIWGLCKTSSRKLARIPAKNRGLGDLLENCLETVLDSSCSFCVSPQQEWVKKRAQCEKDR